MNTENLERYLNVFKQQLQNIEEFCIILNDTPVELNVSAYEQAPRHPQDNFMFVDQIFNANETNDNQNMKGQKDEAFTKRICVGIYSDYGEKSKKKKTFKLADISPISTGGDETTNQEVGTETILEKVLQAGRWVYKKTLAGSTRQTFTLTIPEGSDPQFEYVKYAFRANNYSALRDCRYLHDTFYLGLSADQDKIGHLLNLLNGTYPENQRRFLLTQTSKYISKNLLRCLSQYYTLAFSRITLYLLLFSKFEEITSASGYMHRLRLAGECINSRQIILNSFLPEQVSYSDEFKCINIENFIYRNARKKFFPNTDLEDSEKQILDVEMKLPEIYNTQVISSNGILKITWTLGSNGANDMKKLVSDLDIVATQLGEHLKISSDLQQMTEKKNNQVSIQNYASPVNFKNAFKKWPVHQCIQHITNENNESLQIQRSSIDKAEANIRNWYRPKRLDKSSEMFRNLRAKRWISALELLTNEDVFKTSKEGFDGKQDDACVAKAFIELAFLSTFSQQFLENDNNVNNAEVTFSISEEKSLVVNLMGIINDPDIFFDEFFGRFHDNRTKHLWIPGLNPFTGQYDMKEYKSESYFGVLIIALSKCIVEVARSMPESKKGKPSNVLERLSNSELEVEPPNGRPLN